MAGLSTVDMEVTGTVDMVGQDTAMVDIVDSDCLSWEEDMADTGRLSLAVMADTVATAATVGISLLSILQSGS